MKKSFALALTVFVASPAFAGDAKKEAPAAAPAAKAAAAPAAPPAATKPAPAADPKAPAAMAMPKPAPELDQIKFFAGNWNCAGTAAATPMTGPAHAFKASAKIKRDLGDFWYSIRYEEKKSKEHPAPMTSQGAWGYDAAKKQFVAFGVDNWGGWSHGASKGWEGDKMTWTGEAQMMGQMVQTRETFVKKSDKEVTYAFEMSMQKGQWTPIGEATCKK